MTAYNPTCRDTAVPCPYSPYWTDTAKIVEQILLLEWAHTVRPYTQTRQCHSL